MSAEERLAGLLADGLDLCVRARKLDERTQEAINTSAHVKGNHDGRGSGTVALWIIDAYERDLAAWEARSRDALMETGHGFR